MLVTFERLRKKLWEFLLVNLWFKKNLYLLILKLEFLLLFCKSSGLFVTNSSQTWRIRHCRAIANINIFFWWNFKKVRFLHYFKMAFFIRFHVALENACFHVQHAMLNAKKACWTRKRLFSSATWFFRVQHGFLKKWSKSIFVL
jgi:hypothetical protein